MKDLRLMAIICVIGYLLVFGLLSAVMSETSDDRHDKPEEELGLYY